MPNAPTSGLGVIIPEALLSAQKKLQERYGEQFQQISIDSEWLHFRVANMTEECVVRDLDNNAAAIFGSDMSQLQILRAHDTTKQPGIHIHYLSGFKSYEYRSGAWYY